ncbi:hypothetical protein Y032_1639g3928, partial [Ancylostoma ceylanicum]
MEDQLPDNDIVIVERSWNPTQEDDHLHTQDVFDRLEHKEEIFMSKFTALKRPRTSSELLTERCCEFGCNYRLSR